jgi:hypothetical protein
MQRATRLPLTATVLAAAALLATTALAWDVELTPSPAIRTSIDGGGRPMRTRIDAIRLTLPVLRSDLPGAGPFWESRVEYEGVGFDDFVDAHFTYRVPGIVRIPAGRRQHGDGATALAIYVHGGYGSLDYWVDRFGVVPKTQTEGDSSIAAPALARSLAYASFNLAGWDDDGQSTAYMIEDSGPGRPEDPFVDPETGQLISIFSGIVARAGDITSPQTPSVGRDLTRAAKQAVRAVARSAALAGWTGGQPDSLRAVIAGHSFGGYVTAGIALGVNPLRPGIPSGGNLLDPADPESPPIVNGAIHLAPAIDFYFADPAVPLIPMIFINGETDPLFGAQFNIAARYGEVLAARGYRLRDRVSLWSLGNTAHTPPEFWLDVFGDDADVRAGGDAWEPFLDAALGQIFRVITAQNHDDRRMPASHYDGRLIGGNRVVFPQRAAPPTEFVPFVVDPRWDAFDDDPATSHVLYEDQVASFAAVARELRPTGHLLGPRMANPIGGYRINFDGAELAVTFNDLARRYGSWDSYLERCRKAIEDLEAAGVYVAPRGRQSLIRLLDPAAFDAFKAQGLTGRH